MPRRINEGLSSGSDSEKEKNKTEMRDSTDETEKFLLTDCMWSGGRVKKG